MTISFHLTTFAAKQSIPEFDLGNPPENKSALLVKLLLLSQRSLLRIFSIFWQKKYG